jgi:hypothetical protein
MNVEFNSDGLLGKAYPVERIPGKFPISVLGDSFTSVEAVVQEKKISQEFGERIYLVKSRRELK